MSEAIPPKHLIARRIIRHCEHGSSGEQRRTGLTAELVKPRPYTEKFSTALKLKKKSNFVSI